MDDVDEGGVADRAGVRKGDFLIQVNFRDVKDEETTHLD